MSALAAAKEATIAQLAIAWVAARGQDVVPVVGPRRPDQVASMLDSTRVQLSPAELAEIDGLVPPGAARGDRYPAQHMAALDSERGGPRPSPRSVGGAP